MNYLMKIRLSLIALDVLEISYLNHSMSQKVSVALKENMFQLKIQSALLERYLMVNMTITLKAPED